MKKLILLLLFIPLVSFGQEDIDFDSNLNLTVKDSIESYFGIGFKVETNTFPIRLPTFGDSNPFYDDYGSEIDHSELLRNIIVIDVNYTIKNIAIGLEFGRNFEGNIYYRDGTRRSIFKYGLRLGYKINDKLILNSTNGLNYILRQRPTNYSVKDSRYENTWSKNYFYSKFSVMLNSDKNLIPEFGFSNNGLSVGFVYFFKPKP